ncbi:MAG: hypothetical protein KAJ98_03670, partial [Spirochaetaceae bacterium]|nr:hypothetical protein [Spirochaetaceae bacterium]
GRALDPEPLKRLPFRGRAAGYETMLFRRSFGSRVVPEARAEERSRQNELVHSSHFAWKSGTRDRLSSVCK